jgi:NRAMP (natural resistance-associated macrophage protein)-like metal ion transporter
MIPFLPFFISFIPSGFAPYLFAIALLASGQSSTITGTYAGQFIMEGFLDIKIAQWKRNMITRGIAILPSLAVAIWASTDTMDGIIKWSQVLLSIQLPFAVIPLLNLTSSYRVMGSFRNSWQV